MTAGLLVVSVALLTVSTALLHDGQRVTVDGGGVVEVAAGPE